MSYTYCKACQNTSGNLYHTHMARHVKTLQGSHVIHITASNVTSVNQCHTHIARYVKILQEIYIILILQEMSKHLRKPISYTYCKKCRNTSVNQCHTHIARNVKTLQENHECHTCDATNIKTSMEPVNVIHVLQKMSNLVRKLHSKVVSHSKFLHV